ncbi:MAG TPA: HD domain-containing phosphohydrolase [Thermoanaerobaculia bacterium]|nr:HD domain-containing phosphohydrolase [Thermoanaerobaculia bacterium]
MASISLPSPRILWILLAALVLVGVLPLLLSHYGLIRINRDSMETLERKYLNRSAVSVATEIENLIGNHLAQLARIAGGMQVSHSLLPAGDDPFLHAKDQGHIASFLSPQGDLLALRMLNRSGQGPEAEPKKGLDQSLTQELKDALGAALEGETYIGNLHWLETVNQPTVVMAVPVVAGGEVIGAIEAVVSLQRIASLLNKLRVEGQSDVAAFVVDRGGQVLIHSEPAVNIQRPDYSGNEIVQEFMKEPLRLTQSYVSRESGSPVKTLGTVAPVRGTQWGVVVEREEAKAYASVDRMMRATLQWGGVALALALIIGTYFATRISRPIRDLAARSDDIARGNYQQRVEVKGPHEVRELGENFNLMSAEIEKAVENLKKAAAENHQLFVSSVRLLAAAIDAKDPYTRGHSERVARFSIAIGKQLELGKKDLQDLRISALLHDVGKIGIDDRILRKPAALTDEEFAVMKTHPQKGAVIMAGMAQLIEVIPGMKYHHEKWAGGGYPEGLKGEEIPMQARIISVADTFDAMTTNRPYQRAMELNYVIERIRGFAETRFDPRVVEAFVAAVSAGEIQPEEQVRGAA